MHESTTYRKIINDGRLEEARRFLLRQGTKRFREPDAATVTALEAIGDIDRLEAIGERILDPDLHDWEACSAHREPPAPAEGRLRTAT